MDKYLDNLQQFAKVGQVRKREVSSKAMPDNFIMGMTNQHSSKDNNLDK
ncbi:hypothetical protein OO009_05895 [Flavobacteriaceae bacterium KMM 6897]|nr:hypothetical protein [Flavobacteriaceae bacterium KMM 6897]MEB8345225.1 hypothetical protein [Flavobacteriaceae bacterium KMM 6898]